MGDPPAAASTLVVIKKKREKHNHRIFTPVTEKPKSTRVGQSLGHPIPKNSIIQSYPVRGHFSNLHFLVETLLSPLRSGDSVPELLSVSAGLNHVLREVHAFNLLLLALLPSVGYARSQNRRRRRRDFLNGEVGRRKRFLQAESEEDDCAGDRHGGGDRHPLRAYH